LMAVIAWRLPDDRLAKHPVADAAHVTEEVPLAQPASRSLVEWRVLVLSGSMALITFGYGSVTSFSALFADHLHVSPRSLFLTAMAAAILLGRLTLGRTLDQVGHRRMLLPCLALPAVGLAALAFAQGPITLALAALIFGAGFSLMYPTYTAYVMRHVMFGRRGAAFGAMLAAFDTGVGTGSSAVGWLIHRVGFRGAFSIAALLAALALPYFLFAEHRLGFKEMSQ
jgi:MFS family permease